jgi:SAM-dependent methyltransferase
MPLALRAPEPGTEFRRHRGRLALFRPRGQVDTYWNAYWQRDARLEAMWTAADRGELGEYDAIFRRHLRPDRLTVEAGCGPAHIVLALNRRGYRACGVDLDADVVSVARKRWPELDVHQGDVTRLEFPDASVGAYVSLGVAEHFEDSARPLLAEARRVLVPDGVALISVPYLNAARARHLSRASAHDPPPAEGLSFYQYYYDSHEFGAELAAAGFEVLDEVPLFPGNHLTRDHGLFSRYWNSRLNFERVRPFERRALDRLAAAPNWIKRRFAHMVMFVCRPR